MQRSQPDRGLRKLADETGGGYFELKKTDELAPTFTRVAQELHSLYALGFTPAMLDGKEHKLEVRVKQAGMTARARRSYIASPEAPTTPPTSMPMLTEQDFRLQADRALEGAAARAAAARRRGRLRGRAAERRAAGRSSKSPSPAKFVVSPNAPVRQIWVSAMSRSYKLAWSPEASAFALDGETLSSLVERLARQFLTA